MTETISPTDTHTPGSPAKQQLEILNGQDCVNQILAKVDQQPAAG